VQHPKDVGDRATLAIIMAFHSLGIDLIVDYPELGAVYRVPIEDVGKQMAVMLRASRLLKNLARLLVRQDLPLHTLQGVVDRLRVAAEVVRHLLVGRALEVVT
jgi:hypothetical protein